MGVALRRAGLALLLAAVMVALASCAMYLTYAPRLVSLLVEPVSLLLLPGLAVAMAAAAPNDFSARAVVLWSLLLYTGSFFIVLRRRASAR